MTADLLVIAPYDGGHHAEHVRWIVTAGVDRGLTLTLAASPLLLAGAPEVRDLEGGSVMVRPLATCHVLSQVSSPMERMRATRRVLAEAAHHGPAQRAFLTYLDAAVPALAAPSRKTVPDALSGLLFRPPFRQADPFAGRARLAARRGALQIAARRHLDTVFALDPDVVPALRRLGLRAAALPDPVESIVPQASRDAVRETYGVEPGRRLAVLFGSLEKRKGVFALASALRHLPEAAARRLAVLVVGTTYDSIRAPLTDALADAHRRTEAQVIFRETFLPDADLADLTAAANLVLAPYLGHVGSSGVVVRAAAAGTPILSQEAGQVGREVRRHRLGQTVDPSDPTALAAALAAAVHDPGTAFDLAEAQAYARSRSVEHFTSALYDTLFADG